MTVVRDPMVPAMSRLTRTRRETRDTWTIALEPPEGTAGWSWAPGQFNMLYAFGVGEIPVSISGDSPRSGTLLHTVRAVGNVSRALTRLRPGEHVGVRGPFGEPWPVAEALGRDVIVVAGGLGLAPVRPVVRALAARRRGYGRVALLVGARSPEEIPFRQELERIAARGRIEALLTVDHATTAWSGRVGVVPPLLRQIAFDASRCTVMICGPEVMMRFAVAAAKACRVPDEAIYLSMERNMKCAVGHCGHCQFGPDFVCKDGPVFRFDRVRGRLSVPEL